MEKTGKFLENEKLVLRKPDPEDLGFLYSIENDSEFWFVSDTRTPFSRWQIKQNIENSIYDIYTSKELRLIIESKQDNKSLGIVDLFEYDPFNLRAGLGIVICSEYQCNNIAAEALRLVIDYSFSILGLKQLWCNIDEANIASINLFEKKLGFERSGILKAWKKSGKIFTDVYAYQLINS